MKHTRLSTIAAVTVVFLVVGFALQAVLAATSRPVFVPPIALGLALIAIAVITVFLAMPVYRVARGYTREPIDAYYATRVVLIAKASSIAGALFGGGTGGMLVYDLTRGITVAVGSLVPTVTAVIGGAALLVCGLVAERMCTVPPDDDDRNDGKPQTTRP